MSIKSEFELYREPRKSEENFIQKFLKPLLQRLGFYSVRDYHGTKEFGKDLVFAEIDKFAEISYHGLQAKFEESIGLSMAEELVADAMQAFANPFTHPSTHHTHRITTFVAVNAGSVSEQARTHFFNRMGPHAGSCRVFDGKDILTMDRAAYLGRGQLITETLDGLLFRIGHNRNLVNMIVSGLNVEPRQMHLSRLSDSACAAYLIRPLSNMGVSVDVVTLYTNQVRMLNKCIDGLAIPISLEPTVLGLTNSIRDLAPLILSNSGLLISQINSAINQLRPFIAEGG